MLAVCNQEVQKPFRGEPSIGPLRSRLFSVVNREVGSVIHLLNDKLIICLVESYDVRHAVSPILCLYLLLNFLEGAVHGLRSIQTEPLKPCLHSISCCKLENVADLDWSELNPRDHCAQLMEIKGGMSQVEGNDLD